MRFTLLTETEEISFSFNLFAFRSIDTDLILRFLFLLRSFLQLQLQLLRIARKSRRHLVTSLNDIASGNRTDDSYYLSPPFSLKTSPYIMIQSVLCLEYPAYYLKLKKSFVKINDCTISKRIKCTKFINQCTKIFPFFFFSSLYLYLSFQSDKVFFSNI